ncbi:hypothetical protein [Spiroplasma helicoides]|nr:hypothetical protein [Spiroplasma helicoides]
MKKLTLNDITKYVSWNYKSQAYEVQILPKSENIYTEVIKNNTRNNWLKITNEYELLIKAFPFINNISQNIIQNSIEKMECIKTMIYLSISKKTSEKIILEESDCKNSEHIQIAKRFVSELNRIMYKFNAYEVFANKSFVCFINNKPLICNIDVILKNKNSLYVIELKTSRVNFKEKYNAELYLDQLALEQSGEYRVVEMLILNVSEQQIVMKYDKLPKNGENKIKKIFLEMV